MRMILRAAGLLMILSAAVLFFWQDIREHFTDRVNTRLIEAYQDGDTSVDINPVETMITGIEPMNIGTGTASSETAVESTNDASGSDKSSTPDFGGGMIGVLNIDAANINEPLFSGPVTEEKLKNGISLVNDADNLDMQNIPIAGHKVEGAGIRFNHLDQAEIGDRVELQTNGGTKVYEISDIFEVNPSQTEVMNQSEGDPQQLTLITCEDYNPDTLLFEKRLIVQAAIV